MAAGPISGGGSDKEFESKITIYVILCGIVAAFGGLMFGYDIGISGGVTSMDSFLKDFFPEVYVKRQRAVESNYCKYDNQFLQLFTSSLYLAALVSSFVASTSCNRYGRRPTMITASVFFLAGSVLAAAAKGLIMLIFGRILLGMGVGFANQAVPLFLSEIAPARIRGALNILFQLDVTIGIFIANLVNYFTSTHPWGWRISLGGAGVPAIMLFVGSILITETPVSLIERGHRDQGRAMLKRVRGTDKVDLEFMELVSACEQAAKVKQPFRNLLKRRSRPQLVIAVLMQVFQQFTGINAIMFYAPVLFQTIGYKSDGALMAAVITGIVNVGCTVVSVVLVDRLGRRKLLLEACVQMLISQLAIGGILIHNLHDTNSLPRSAAVTVVFFVCLYVSCFAWSWGPMGWLIPSETFPLETRTAGFACAVSSNMLFTFLIAQAFLSMMCHMKAGIFFFFSGWIVLMALFVVFLLPETKGVPIDEMADRVWKQHWYWKRYMAAEADGDNDEN